MKNTLIRGFGRIAHYRDFTEVIRYPDGYIEYRQTNNIEEARNSGVYNQRIVGLHMTSDHTLAIGVAVASLHDPSVNLKSGLQVVKARVRDLVEKYELDMSSPSLRACTVVPIQFSHLLVDDPYTYSNISGPLDPEYLEQCIDLLKSLETKFYKKQLSNYFLARKRNEVAKNITEEEEYSDA